MQRLLILATLMLFAAGADAAINKGSLVRITLRSGGKVLGEVVSQSDDALVVANGGATRTVPFSEVVNLEELQGPAPAREEPPPPPPAPEPATSAVNEPPPPPPQPVPVEQSQTASAPEPVSSTRFAASAGGFLAPSNSGLVWAISLEGALVLGGSKRWDARVLVNFTDVEDDYTATRALLVGAAGTFWVGRLYGLGGGVMLGYGDFFAKQWHGWDDETMVLAPFITPVKLRFGSGPQHQLALDVVLTYFTSRSVAVPFGRLSYTMVF